MKKPPPLLLGLALLFWGWQTGFLLLAAPMAAILESARLIKARWDLTDDDFTRIWTFCSLLLLAAAAYAFTANDGPSNLLTYFRDPSALTQRGAGTASARATTALMRWLPIVFFPFIAAQTFSSREGVPLHIVSLILRRRWLRARERGQPPPASSVVNVTYAYFGVCLFGASLHHSEGVAFFWGLCGLLAAALWCERSAYFGRVTWLGALMLVVGLGFLGQWGINQFQHYLGNFDPHWLSRFAHRGFDPTHSKTRIGDIGRLQDSSTIVIRLQTAPRSAPPRRLREASYHTYRARVWYAAEDGGGFQEIHERPPGTFVLVPAKTNTETLNIASYLPGGKGLLPLPEGSGRLENLPAFSLKKNDLGAVYAEGPGLVIFDAHFGPGRTIDSPPDTSDRHVPAGEIPALKRVISELGLRGLSLKQTLQRVQTFFQRHFTYSLEQEQDFPSQPGQTPISRFLLLTRRGHCEYFATATVLLLRQLGIPARYAVGYAVHEARGHGKYIVRQRDAHAWCLVWNGQTKLWQDFDTTPGSWIADEEARASALQWLSDLFSNMAFEFSKIRWGQAHLRKYILLGLAPIIIILFFQILFRMRRRKRPRSASQQDAGRCPGLDSEFYQIEKKLVAHGLPRQAGEPLLPWLRRAFSDPRLQALERSLSQLLYWHYRYRFDPLGLTPAERQALQRQTAACLAQLDEAFRTGNGVSCAQSHI